MMRIILYSKPGCHLCEGLQEKLEQVAGVDLEIRDITTRDDWFAAYQYEIPVLFGVAEQPMTNANLSGNSSPETPTSRMIPLPRPSPRVTVQQLEQMLQKHLPDQ